MTERPYDVEVTRVLDAPPERVYQAFTDPDPARGARGAAPARNCRPGPPGVGDDAPKLESLLSG